MAEEQPAPPVPAPLPPPSRSIANQRTSQGKGMSLPFILGLIGGILVILSGAILIVMGSMTISILPIISMWTTLISMLPISFGIVMIVGALLTRKTGKERVGNILVLVISIISLSVGGGLFIATGSILGIVGGALGLEGK